ncbi:hypothetical protein H0H93_007037 [Arthromyces matolae]|nr:hypothetical protein H0H93_007037 [Arthromyces matolae]
MYKSLGLIQTAILSVAFAAGALWIYRSRLKNWEHAGAPSNAGKVDDHASESDLSEELVTLPSNATPVDDHASESDLSEESVTLPSNATPVDDHASEPDLSEESVTLPSNPSSPTPLTAPHMDLTNQGFALRLRPASSLGDFKHKIADLRSTLSEYSRSLFAMQRATGVASLGNDMQWSTSNLELLTNSLRSIWPKIQSHCELAVVLPTIGGVVSPNPTPNALPILPLQLEKLSWTGHRDQLDMFFGDPSFPFWRNLTRLALECNGLTLDDCQSILYQGRHTLQHVEIRTIGRVNRSQILIPFVSHLGVIKPIEMSNLESLDIESLANVDVLFSNFVYPRIHALTLQVKHSEFDVVKGCLKLLSRNATTPIRRWRLDLRGILDPLQVSWIYDNNDDPSVNTDWLKRENFVFWDL